MSEWRISGFTARLAEVPAPYRILYIVLLIFFALLLMLCLLRGVKGPRIADRLVAVNMMGTMVMVMIAILAQLLDEGYLVDICLIYALISFLAVIVLTKVYTGVYLKQKQEGDGEDEHT